MGILDYIHWADDPAETSDRLWELYQSDKEKFTEWCESKGIDLNAIWPRHPFTQLELWEDQYF